MTANATTEYRIDSDETVDRSGDDVLYGGAGRDIFVIGAGRGTDGAADIIMDFSPDEDYIRLPLSVAWADVRFMRGAGRTGPATHPPSTQPVMPFIGAGTADPLSGVNPSSPHRPGPVSRPIGSRPETKNKKVSIRFTASSRM